MELTKSISPELQLLTEVCLYGYTDGQMTIEEAKQEIIDIAINDQCVETSAGAILFRLQYLLEHLTPKTQEISPYDDEELVITQCDGFAPTIEQEKGE